MESSRKNSGFGSYFATYSLYPSIEKKNTETSLNSNGNDHKINIERVDTMTSIDTQESTLTISPHVKLTDMNRSSISSMPKPREGNPFQILHSFIQLFGYFTLDPNIIDETCFDSIRSKAMYQPLINKLKTEKFGGGSLNQGSVPAKDQLLPVYSMPPSLMFHDLILEDGETKSFKFEIQLPESLPPSQVTFISLPSAAMASSLCRRLNCLSFIFFLF
jgi:hypothetical protein